MPDKQVIHVPGLKTIGPYSQAARAAGLLFVSGQPGVDPSTGEAAGPTFDVQARQAFKNLDAVLRAGGSRLDLVVNTTVLVAELVQFRGTQPPFRRIFSGKPSWPDDHERSAA